MNDAYLLSGLPGAGKTTVANIGKTITGGSVLSAGELIRQMAASEGLTDATSDELGEFAAAKREELGDGFFGEKAVGMLLRGEIELERPVFVDSVRHINGANEFLEYFDAAQLWLVDADRYTRLERLQDRGRDDESTFDMGDLLKRDSRELQDLGTETLLDSGRIDRVIPNDGTEAQLRELMEQTLDREPQRIG